MKKISALAGAGILILSIGLAGISFAKDQTTGKTVGKTPPASAAEKSNKKVGKTGNEVVARVNGTDITMHELNFEMNLIGPSIIKDPKKRTPELDKKVRDTAMGILVFKELAVQEAVRQGMKVKPAAVEEARKQLKLKLGSENNYRDYLQKTGLTEAAMGRLLEKDILFNQITQKEIFQKVKANDGQAIEKRKVQWEKGLRKKAKIEILLPK